MSVYALVGVGHGGASLWLPGRLVGKRLACGRVGGEKKAPRGAKTRSAMLLRKDIAFVARQANSDRGGWFHLQERKAPPKGGKDENGISV